MLDFLQFRGPWDWLQAAAWLVSIALLGWMVLDAIRTGRKFNEDVLASSQEGVDELLQHHDRVR
ncbi:hypothetical protein [Dongia deserti]|uniref:hypothetical protein n=1 Tax=Dongia deserti TaxID=2268030 RepID=UPI000E654C78|nr:hypothetical protein [Dongia deserti]